MTKPSFVAPGAASDADGSHPQNIDAASQLAAGIAHDFNNLLAAIVGHTDVLLEYFAPGDPRVAEVEGIRHAAALAADLTRQLMAFGSRQVLQPVVLDLNDVIARAEPGLARLVGDRIAIVIEPARPLARVMADATQIEQILLQLAINARDAMPDGGRLTLRTRNVSVPAIGGRPGLGVGDYVALTVSDSGSGIDAAVQPHLFEPFFTTKESGRGAGMGLATVYGIVKQSGGHITVDSEAGRGAAFTVYLPVTQEVVKDDAGEESTAPSGPVGTVLVTEADPAVRGLIADVLRRHGFRVLVDETAGDGAFDLMIVEDPADDDPGEAPRPPRPGARTLVLRKPFTPESLVRQVREAME